MALTHCSQLAVAVLCPAGPIQSSVVKNETQYKLITMHYATWNAICVQK